MNAKRMTIGGAALCLLATISPGQTAPAGNWTSSGPITETSSLVLGGMSKSVEQPNSALLQDDFEISRIDTRRWWLGQAQKGQFWIDSTHSQHKTKSIALRMAPEMRGCGTRCQKNEIRTAPRHRIKFGSDAWYSFSFKLDGKLPGLNSRRWVSGQWKQQNGGSPFLAQRFHRGIFQITVQDNDCRVTVASSEPLDHALPFSTQLAHGTSGGNTCSTDITIEHGTNPVLPDATKNWVHMRYRIRGGRNGTGLVKIYANGRFIARVTGSIGYDEAVGPNQYFKFGIYRNPEPGTSIARFDNFRRAATKPGS